MLQTLLFALLAAVSSGSGASGPWMLLKSPVVVEARLLRGEPEAPAHMADFEFLIDIRDANATEQVETFLIAVHDLPDALRVLRRTVVWRAPYLFVRSECGGGIAWACSREVIFKITNGRVSRIGALAVGERRQPALSFRGGHFIDLYDKLEGAFVYTGLSHACAPGFQVVLSERGGHLVVAPSATWSRNRGSYRKMQQLIDAYLAGESDDEDGFFRAVVHNAALAEYCKRYRELKRLLLRTDPHLDLGQQHSLRRALNLVVPLEPPACSREPDQERVQ